MDTTKSLPQDEDVDLLDLLIIMLKRKKIILSITFGAAIVTAVLSLLLPPIYRAETKILPPQRGDSGMAAQLLSQLGGTSGLFGSMLPVKTPNELYIEMLKSRTVLDRIIDRFDLMKSYEKKYREDAQKRLMKALRAEDEEKSGIISISVEDRSPEKAAAMANAFVEELKSLSSGLAVTEAAQRRLFFKEQLNAAKEALTKAEESIRGFQEETGALHIDSQARAVIESVASIKAQIAAKEVQLKVLRSFATAQNPDLQRTEAELRGMQAELTKLEARDEGGHNPLMPTKMMPEVGTEYVRRLRDLKYNETLFDLMAKQYELARLDEARDAAIIQVIDWAVPPGKKAKPRRSLMVILATTCGFFFSVMLVVFLEFIDRSYADSEGKKKLESVTKYLKLR